MTLKDIRDQLSRMFASDRSLETTEVNHALIEDISGIQHIDYMLTDDDDEDEEDDYEYDDDDDYEDDDIDSELDSELF